VFSRMVRDRIEPREIRTGPKSFHVSVDTQVTALMNIRLAIPSDFEQIWPIFQEIVLAGETYAFAPDITKAQAFDVWMKAPRQSFVVEEHGKILGAYFLRTNQAGPGDHVCNCGYIVSSSARGRGLATAMCEHSQRIAVQLGYKAMQFNIVVSTNETAVKLWTKLGFATVGRLPKAFRHPVEGYVDAFVMYKWLDA
jgi:ribosomal protein S18 acetylase RimI-like enzyme